MLAALATYGFAPSLHVAAGGIAGHGAVRMAPIACSGSDSLDSWLQNKAMVSDKFLGAVLATCEEEMIGSVENLETLSKAGLLGSVFKPVVAASIEAALSGSGAAMATSAPAAALPLAEVRRQLMLNGQDTWGSEAALRSRLDMFTAQFSVEFGAQWDPDSMAWSGGLPIAAASASAAE